jgi:hypothetical protein
MIKIDKNIPIPKSKREGDTQYPWGIMEVGDSFFIKTDSKRPPVSTNAAAKRHPGKKFSQRIVEGGFRYWRIE